MLSGVILKPWQMYSPSRISHYKSHRNPAIQLILLFKDAEYHPGEPTTQTHTIPPPIKFPLHSSSISTFNSATCKVVMRLTQLLEMLFIYQVLICNNGNKSIQSSTVANWRLVAFLGILRLICWIGLKSSEVHHLQGNLQTHFFIQAHRWESQQKRQRGGLHSI